VVVSGDGGKFSAVLRGNGPIIAMAGEDASSPETNTETTGNVVVSSDSGPADWSVSLWLAAEP